MPTVSQYFNLGKSQSELDFVNVSVEEDNPLFIDPFAISQRSEEWSRECHFALTTFFQQIIDYIKSGQLSQAKDLLSQLHEPNETRLGYSRQGYAQGAGVGPNQANEILKALSDSAAIKTGFISSIEECELMIDGISRDKISDLTTNIIRKNLAQYTKEQCMLWSIPLQTIALPPYYEVSSGAWTTDYFDLPIIDNKPLVLVPKIIARYDLAYDHQKYYHRFVLDYLQAETLNAGSSLVKTLKNGKRRVYKKDLKSSYPLSKKFLLEFSQQHPNVLAEYRTLLERAEQEGKNVNFGSSHQEEDIDVRLLAQNLIKTLPSIPSGATHATDYHNFIIGVVEFIFFPHLLNPRKEQQIHSGRKRIDILVDNGATGGVFFRLHDVAKIPCRYIAIECKNYTKEVENPELDQLSSRFSTNRGKVGFLFCRKFDDRARFIQRCADTFKDDRGLIITLDDEIVLELLQLISAKGKEADIDSVISRLIDKVCLG